jgi:hypothetical protein
VQRGSGSASAAGGAADGAEGLAAQLELHRGSVVFVPAGAAVKFTASAAGGLTVWGAAVNAKVFAPVPVPAAAEEAAPAKAAEPVAEPALVAA